MGKIVVSLGFCHVIAATCQFQPRFPSVIIIYTNMQKHNATDKKKKPTLFFENAVPIVEEDKYFVWFSNFYVNRISIHRAILTNVLRCI